jgi:FKBP12-rapamycin complex-associated protein
MTYIDQHNTYTQAFVAAHGADLQAALGYCKEFSLAGNEKLLQLAWERFYTVLRQLGRELMEAKTLQLEQVSPQLLLAQNLVLAVPGTYRADRDVVAIQGFAPAIKVMTSKQRPRRLAVTGSDGLEYVFLLKGHEDLRQVAMLTTERTDSTYYAYYT